MLLVVGGGPGTYRTVLETLRKKRPVVCLPDSGGAARAIYEYVQHGFDGVEIDQTDVAAYANARTYLPDIKEAGEQEVRRG